MRLFFRRRPTAAVAPGPAEPSPADRRPGGTARRLLVCDDNNSVTQLLELLFAGEGWDVRVTATGEDGLAQLGTFGPDVVLLDQQMGGGLTGIETATVLRGRGFDLPVFLFSAHLDANARAAADMLDVVPVSKIDFQAVVRHVTAAHAEAQRSGLHKSVQV